MNTITSMRSVWSGTVEVAPEGENNLIGSAVGAYVSAVGIANSQDEFLSGIDRAMHAMRFKIIDIDDVCKLEAEDIKRCDASMQNRILSLSKENPIELGSFHLF